MSIKKHTAANLIGSLVPIIIALITVPLYLHYIGTERYGVLAVIWALLGYFGFFDLGFGRAVLQRMAKLTDISGRDRSNLLWTALTVTFILGILGSAVLWFIADYFLAYKINMSASNRIEASNAVFWLFLALPLLLPASVLQSALQARLRFVELNLIQILGSTISQLLPLAFAASGYVELQILVPAVLASRMLTTALLFNQCKLHVPLNGMPVIDRNHLKEMMGYGGWALVIGMLGPLLVTIDRLVIATISGAKSVSFYSVPFDLASRTMIISGSLSTAIFPRLASASIVDAKDIAIKSTKILCSVMTPIIIFGIFFVHPFIILWVGNAFADSSAGVAEVILFGVWINAAVIPHNARLLADKTIKKVAFILLLQVPIYLSMLWFGVTHWGVLGAAFAWTLRVMLDTTMQLHAAMAFQETIKVYKPALFIVTTALIIALVTEVSSPIRWICGVILLCLVFLNDKKSFFAAMSYIRTRNYEQLK